MDSLIEKLVGNIIHSVEIFDDCVLIVLEEGGTVNLFNKIHRLDVEDVIGESITDIKISESSFKMILHNDYIEMGLNDFDYSGPEALVYRDGRGSIIVL